MEGGAENRDADLRGIPFLSLGPKTPVKYSSINHLQDYQGVGVRLLESQVHTPNYQVSQNDSCNVAIKHGNFHVIAQSESVPSCSSLLGNVGIPFGSYQQSSGSYGEPGDSDSWMSSSMGFGELLALANQINPLAGNYMPTFSSQAAASNYQFPGFQDSQPQELCTMPEVRSNYVPHTQSGEESTVQNYKADWQMNFGCVDKLSTKDYVESSKNNEGIMEILGTEKTCPVTGQMSTQLQENQNLDKVESEESLLLKTPQQKPRKKKHRPKVIRENQSKRTPKLNAEKAKTPQETTKAKRKSVQQEELNGTLEENNDNALNGNTPSHTGVGEQQFKHTRKDINKSQGTTDKVEMEVPRRTARRSLNFEIEIQARDEGSRRSLNFNTSSQARYEGISESQGTPRFKLDSHARDEVGRRPLNYNCSQARDQGINESHASLNLNLESRARYKSINGGYQGAMAKVDMVFPQEIAQSTCRRSHNFNLGIQARDDSSSSYPSWNHNTELQKENLTAKGQLVSLICKKELNALTRENNAGITQEYRNMASNAQEEYWGGKQELSGLSPSKYMDFQQNLHELSKENASSRRQCQMTFSNQQHDITADSIQVMMNPNDHVREKTAGAPFYTNTHVMGLKRQQTEGSIRSEICNRNVTGMSYNSMQAYYNCRQPGLPISSEKNESSQGLHPSQAFKRKRTENALILPASRWPWHSKFPYNTAQLYRLGTSNSCTSLLASTSNLVPLITQYEAADASRKTHPPDGIQKTGLIFQDPSALNCRPKTNRISKCPTQQPDLSSSHKIPGGPPASPCNVAISRTKQLSEILYPQHKHVEALAFNNQQATATTKQSKRSMPNKSSGKNMYFAGIQLKQAMEIITEKLNRLDLDAEASQQKNAIQLHGTQLPECHALTLFKGSGAIVPFDGQFEPMRRKQRAKVDLDDETTRVWKLLLENINSEGIDGTDEENAKWWDEERRIFNGRADSFIARMHLVQGDRRFSPWKGSVVDSVVGVFLTQNVSDHLSSSAFMSLVARFPITPNRHKEELHEESHHNKIRIPEVIVSSPDGTSGLTKEIMSQSNHAEGTGNNHPSVNVEIGKEMSIKSLGHGLREGMQKESANSSENEQLKSLEALPRKPIILIEDEGCMETACSPQIAENSSQNSADSPNAQTIGGTGSRFSVSEEETAYVSQLDKSSRTISMENLLLQDNHWNESCKELSCGNCEFQSATLISNQHGTQARENGISRKNGKDIQSYTDKEHSTAEVSGLSLESSASTRSQAIISKDPKYLSPNTLSSNINQTEAKHEMRGNQTQNIMDVTSSSSHINSGHKEVSSSDRVNSEQKEANSKPGYNNDHHENAVTMPKQKGKPRKEKETEVDWEKLRKRVISECRERPRTTNTNDSVDWEAVRCADVNEIAQAIKERGMNNMLAERIKEFLNRLVGDHGRINLEWLRDLPPDKAKEYLLSYRGLGLKSVECVRLLTLHHLAFPVDTNVSRIAVRLGWVPLQPLPESLQLHLLELYPVLESIQKYLWPRLCKLDQKTLYELHYQMITFGKVFCTKSKPNCNACPMRAECRHFASAFASARLALPAPDGKGEVATTENRKDDGHRGKLSSFQMPLIKSNHQFGTSNCEPIIEEPPSPEPFTEVPATPELDLNVLDDNTDEIPTIQLNMDVLNHNLQKIIQQNTELQEGDMSKALVALTSEAASIPVPKLKNVSRLRTEHRVYELHDSHPLLDKLQMDNRELDDPSPYLLAIWAPGETASSIEQPQRQCSTEGTETLCTEQTCSSCNRKREENSLTVRGTILIPCRTAMRGSFPLNGTYFQVNEVFSDHDSSLCPIDVPRKWLWNLPRRTVYFGTSIPTIFKGLSTEEIQYCFWRGFVCVRGFDRKTRAPRPLLARFHFPVSKIPKGKREEREKFKMNAT